MFILYDIIFFLYMVFYIPCLLMRGKWHSGLWQRWGFFSSEMKKSLRQKKNIWVHAVSVGEVLSVAGLLEELAKRYPNDHLVLSVVTPTGFHLAQSKFGPKMTVIYAPLDFSWVVRRYINLIRPKIYLVAETEIWPNLWSFLHQEKIPIVQVNGRISTGAFRIYRQVRWFIKPVLRGVSAFCVQSEGDAKRIIELGADADKIHVVGNIKFDDLPREIPSDLKGLGFKIADELLIAGSTHKGEEDIMLEIFKAISPEFKDLRLVLAPRHPERAAEVIRLVERAGFEAVRFSQIKNSKIERQSIVVVDTIGQLRSLYALGTIIFVGKSLTVGGGQNIIEPGFFAKPVLVGPWMQNFQDVLEIFLQYKAVVQVQDKEELREEIERLLKSPQQMEVLGSQARSVIEKFKGARARTSNIISQYI